MVKALVLFSGGLDSTLAAKIVQNQGVHTQALFLQNAFLQKDAQELTRLADRLGIKLHILDISASHLELVQRPRFGYGRNKNPCIDCRILMLQVAKDFMQQHGFSFLVSGEVLGQRPMSQRKDNLNLVGRQAHIAGILLRPLSAKLLQPTIPEGKGWVDRNKLFAFSGRSRKGQLALAKELGIEDYFTPAGGCLLTEAEFSRRFKDLGRFGQVCLEEVRLLKSGRHFRYEDSAKIIVGRDEQENEDLMQLAKGSDVIFKLCNYAGPLTVVRKNGSGPCVGLEEAAAALTARYSKARDEDRVKVLYGEKDSSHKKEILVRPAQEDLIKRLRI